MEILRLNHCLLYSRQYQNQCKFAATHKDNPDSRCVIYNSTKQSVIDKIVFSKLHINFFTTPLLKIEFLCNKQPL